jgi:hypothetical protein
MWGFKGGGDELADRSGMALSLGIGEEDDFKVCSKGSSSIHGVINPSTVVVVGEENCSEEISCVPG